MKPTIPFFLALSALFFTQICLACNAPEKISIPNGKKATEQEMIQAGERYHQYMLDNQLYQVCLEDEAKTARRNESNPTKADVDTRENQLTGRHNAASAAMRNATREFEKAIEDYEARQ